MTYKITSAIVGWQNIDVTDTVQRHPLGTRVQAVDPTYGAGEFIYLLGVASTAIGTAVIFEADNWATTRTTTSTKGPVAIAMSANVASQYGWYQVRGKAIVKAATVADNGDVYATATDGTLDDAVADGYMVHLARFASADGTPSAGLAEIEINDPYIDAIASND